LDPSSILGLFWEGPEGQGATDIERVMGRVYPFLSRLGDVENVVGSPYGSGRSSDWK